MTRLLNTLSVVAGAAVAGLTALPMDGTVRAYVVFVLGLVVVAVNAYLGKAQAPQTTTLVLNGYTTGDRGSTISNADVPGSTTPSA